MMKWQSIVQLLKRGYRCSKGPRHSFLEGVDDIRFLRGWCWTKENVQGIISFVRPSIFAVSYIDGAIVVARINSLYFYGRIYDFISIKYAQKKDFKLLAVTYKYLWHPCSIECFRISPSRWQRLPRSRIEEVAIYIWEGVTDLRL